MDSGNFQGMHSVFLLVLRILITSSRMVQLPGSEDAAVIYRDKSEAGLKLRKFIESGIQNLQVLKLATFLFFFSLGIDYRAVTLGQAVFMNTFSGALLLHDLM